MSVISARVADFEIDAGHVLASQADRTVFNAAEFSRTTLFKNALPAVSLSLRNSLIKFSFYLKILGNYFSDFLFLKKEF